MSDTLYDDDFVIWTERQAEALRQAAREGSNLPLDFENLAEDIADLGSEVRHQVESLSFQIMVHLLKLACSPASEPRRKWLGETDEFRRQLDRRLRTSPALRAGLGEIVDGERPAAFREAARSFRRHGNGVATGALEPWRQRGISAAEVLTDGLYPKIGSLTFSMTTD